MPWLHSIFASLPNLDLTAVLDILVVAFLVYQALMVVRGTRAGHILVGILIMVLLYLGAVWAGLEALRSLLSFIVPYLGLAVIVLFQSEIRRTLARTRTQALVRPRLRFPPARLGGRNPPGGRSSWPPKTPAPSSCWSAISASAPSSKAACAWTRTSRATCCFPSSSPACRCTMAP